MSPHRIASSNRRMIVAIVAMVVVWAMVMLQRNAIRARWWEYQLVRVESLEDRARYLALLANLGDRALPAAERLLHSEDASARSYGLVILNQASSPRAGQLLRRAAADPDPDIRRGAVRGLGARGDLAALAEIVQSSDSLAACAAVEALASIGSAEAIEVLIAQASQHPLVNVRVQAIECLGELEAAQAVGVLTDCLEDGTVFEGATLAERSAARVIQAASPGQPVEWPGSRTVADFAAAALERITGRPRATEVGHSDTS